MNRKRIPDPSKRGGARWNAYADVLRKLLAGKSSAPVTE
jgi:hypothetical protein